ncbi:hypothetical protein CALVIDRAFT_600789 [Calocera viscosa TUFC12733]|uniref:Uncharacterized protein n=1 Tax=Calocera viscosa (strain TUFC12733) TaxID=1330018 RepID=A0A167J897_CALVF|nr:hypothetical protein CALVIDRAFT_600789 [Calocera viscosa TUFC12733]
MELELEQELEMENTLVFAGESSGSEMGKGFPSAAGSGSGQGQGQGMDTPFETSGLWRELEGMLGGIGPVGSVGEEEGRAGKGERQAKGEKDGKEEEGQSAYIPVFGPALAAALARNAPPQPRTPSTGSSLHKDVKDVLQGLTWSDEEWEDEPEEEEEEEEDGQTPVVERTGRLFARPTLRRSQRSVRRRPTRRL